MIWLQLQSPVTVVNAVLKVSGQIESCCALVEGLHSNNAEH